MILDQLEAAARCGVILPQKAVLELCGEVRRLREQILESQQQETLVDIRASRIYGIIDYLLELLPSDERRDLVANLADAYLDEGEVKT